MKKTFKLKNLALSLAVAGAASVAMIPAASQAGVSANVGMVSSYVFRGVLQTSDASASAGLDYENDSGFYVGTWGADVGGGTDGLEYDLYGGWAGEFEGVSLGLGATGYFYTGDFDTSYKEYNLSAGYGPIEIGYAGGVYEDGAVDETDSDYTDMYISASYEGATLTYGKWDADTDLDDNAITRVELGYELELAAGLDGSVTYVKAMSEASGVDDEDYLVFGVSKSFDLM